MSSLYVHVIESEFEKRKVKNPQYSVRAFARDLNVHHTTLLGALNGSRSLSRPTLEKVLERLGVDGAQKNLILRDLLGEKFKKGALKIDRDLKAMGDQVGNQAKIEKKLSIQEFERVSSWYHFAILELTEIEGFKSDAQWVGRRLNISTECAANALENLKAVGLLQKIGNRWRKAHLSLTTYPKSRTSESLKQRQKDILLKSVEAIDATKLEQRAHHAMTFPIDPSKIPYAKKKIREFIYEMTQLLEVSPKEEVYELQISLFPLSHSEQEPD